MQALSDFRGQARSPDADPNALLDHLTAFIDANKGDPIQERAPDLAESVGAMADVFALHNASPQDDAPLAVGKRIHEALERLNALNPAAPSAELRARVEKDLTGVRSAVDHALLVRAAVRRVDEAAKSGTPSEAVRNVLKQIAKEKINQSNIDQQPDVVQIRERVYADHLTQIQYRSEEKVLPKAEADPVETRFIVDPLVAGTTERAPADDPVVLAVSRGILYALARTNGRIKWAVRVGVDATELPVRVPAAQGVPERILVVSADDKALDALDGDGARLWRYRMAAPCIGRPLVVGNVAYLADYDGNVHEVELAQGKLLGIYPLGQRLTVGGARDPNSGLLYFPADDFCVYEIDPQAHQCKQVHYTGHPAGSLRGEPLIVSAPDDGGLDADWLILNEAHGLGATRLSVYRLPFGEDRDAPPVSLKTPPEVPGWTWFPPSRNGEQLAMVGDSGVLSLFDIRQPGNLHDPLLFPALNALDLAPAAGAKTHGRSEMVEVQGQDLWVLAGGTLQRYYLELNAVAGPRMTPAAGWRPLDLGSPLHASQAETDPATGRTTLVLATQPLTRQINLATAVDDRGGEVLWQRQLGLVCQADPLELPREGGPPILVVLDQGGGLFAFDPAKHANLADGEWRDAGQPLFGALDDGPGAPPALLPGPDGRSAYEFASPGDGKRLVIRRVEVAGNELNKDPERVIPLNAPLAGTPAVADKMMILPLADGSLWRLMLPLTDGSAPVKGSPWRSKRSALDARARVTILGPETFLASDGARGLTHWQWPPNGLWRVLPPEKGIPTLQAQEGGSLAADPVVLPDAKDGPRRICIADVSGTVSLLAVGPDGSLRPGRRWNVGGRVTAGPYLQTVDGATRIGCVVDGKRLAWIDPEKDGLLWTYPEKVGADLVGRPRLVGGLVVVADQAGRIVALNPETGRPAGGEVQLGGSAAPTGAPADFGGGRLFVPLTDGTVLLPKWKPGAAGG